MGEHLDHLQKTFRRMHEHDLKIRFSKCQFAQSSVQLFGHVVTENEIGVDKIKIAAIKSSPISTPKAELRSFFELWGDYPRFIKGIAETSFVLNTSMPAKMPLTSGRVK